MTLTETLKARDALIRKYKKQGKSKDWLKSWNRGWIAGGKKDEK